MNENEKKLDLENFGKSTLYVATEKRQLPEDRTEPAVWIQVCWESLGPQKQTGYFMSQWVDRCRGPYNEVTLDSLMVYVYETE